VDDRLRTTNPRVFATGDVCSQFRPQSGRPLPHDCIRDRKIGAFPLENQGPSRC
jgi:hypothetical protein